MFLEFAPHLGLRDVEDPYMRGPTHYERALDLIEEGCKGLLAEIKKAI
jgi:protein-tyrosine phosphatase